MAFMSHSMHFLKSFKIIKNRIPNNLTYTKCFSITSQSFSDKVPDSAVPKPVGTEYYTAINQPENGKIYDKKPFKLRLEKGKRYKWCLCGNSKSQPLCDGTHRMVVLKIKLRPVVFEVDETKDYWLCNCKQTTHRPFCDGTHKQPDIQAAVRS